MFITNIINNVRRYSFLMQQLIIRDFKVKYKRSVLGVVWSLLYPLLMMSVMAVVFSQMFKFKVEGVNYLVYLMSGIVMFNYFSESTNSSMMSIVGNFSLINKIYIPKYIFPISKCLFSGINFLFTLIPLLLVIIFTGSGDTKCIINIYYLFIPVIFCCYFMFTLGLSFFLSSFSVFLRDVIYIYGIVLTLWNYLTPVFYSISIIPENLQKFFMLNPLYVYIDSVRSIVLFSKMPTTQNIILMFLYGILILLAGALFFKKKQDKFIYYV